MDYGYIQLQRKILKWEWYKDGNTKNVFLHLLLTASWKDTRWRGIDVKRGQVVTSIRHLSDELNLSERTIRTSIDHLTKSGEIDKQSTSKYSVITVLNYDKYQTSDTQSAQEVTDKTTNNTSSDRQTNGEQPTTSNKDNKNNKNNKNKNYNNINPPISPQGEWDYLRHTNLENTKHILNTGLYTDAELLKDYPRLWECIKTWMKYKDEKTPRKDNHYAGDTSIVTLLNKFVKHCQSSGEDAVIEIVETSISSNYRGILWDKLQEPRTNNTTRSQQIDEQMKDW